MSRIKLIILAILAFFPSFLKRPLYRVFFDYKIGKGVKIGITVLDAKECEIDKKVRIGHFNVFTGINRLSIGDHSRIGHLNIIRGGVEVKLGRYTEILRLNEINAIPDPIASNPVDSRFELGDGSIIVASHKIDFTDRVIFGKRCILGGRNSSLWTHNRQETKPIVIGDYTYLGSEIRITPGCSIPAKSVVGIGSVVTSSYDDEYWLIAGIPAEPVKKLEGKARDLVFTKTRPDLPDEIV